MKEKTKKFVFGWKKTLKEIDWVFFSILLISLLSPFIYKFLKIFWISTLGADWLADYQVESGFTNLLFETLTIFVIVPIYAFVNRNISNERERKEKYFISFLIGLLAAFILFLLVVCISFPFVHFLLSNDTSTLNPSEQILLFIAIAIGFTLMLINNLMVAFIVLRKKHKEIIFITFLSLFVHIFLDFLLISGLFFETVSLKLVIISIIVTPLVNLLILLIFVFLVEIKEWIYVVKNLSFKKWRNDLKIYKKTSLFVGIETLIWNMAWFWGIMIPFILLGNSSDYGPTVTTGALLADSLFWVVLSIPLTAATYLQAEHHSRGIQKEQHNQIVKEGFVIAFFVGISWLIIGPLIILVVYPAMLRNLNPAEAEQAICWTQRLCWIMFGFYFFMLFARIIYAYWATTGQGFKVLLGTLFSVTIVWIPAGILFMTGVITTPTEVALLYGIGLMMIFISYFVQWILEFKKDFKFWNWYLKLTKFEEPVIEYDPEVIDEF